MRELTKTPLLFAIVFVLSTLVSLWPNVQPVSAAAYAIGDTGPAGGLIFHIDGDTYYEAAPSGWNGGADPTAQWGCLGQTLPGADGTAIGTGEQNTADILASCATAGTAARIADSYTGSDVEDWFLPSSDELDELYQQKAIVGGLSPDFYWSSSEAPVDDFGQPSGDFAYAQSFDNGFIDDTTYKDMAKSVRPIRSFAESEITPFASASTTVSASLAPTITLSTSGSVDLSVTPNPTEQRFWSANDTVSVSTNNSTGYTLSVANGDTDRSLRSGGNSIPAWTATTASPVFISQGEGPVWAFRVDSGAFGAGPTSAENDGPGTSYDWAGVPDSTSPAQIKTTSSAVTGETIDVWYGVMIGIDSPSGTYTDTVMYTAVTN